MRGSCWRHPSVWERGLSRLYPHLLSLTQLDLQGLLELLVLLAPPLLVLLQEDLSLLLGLLQELQLDQLALPLLLQGLQPLQLLLLGLPPLLTLFSLLPPLQLQIFVEGVLPFHVKPDGRLDGCGGDKVKPIDSMFRRLVGDQSLADLSSTPVSVSCLKRSSHTS